MIMLLRLYRRNTGSRLLCSVNELKVSGEGTAATAAKDCGRILLHRAETSLAGRVLEKPGSCEVSDAKISAGFSSCPGIFRSGGLIPSTMGNISTATGRKYTVRVRLALSRVAAFSY